MNLQNQNEFAVLSKSKVVALTVLLFVFLKSSTIVKKLRLMLISCYTVCHHHFALFY